MSLELANQLLADLGKTIGINDLVLDADGYCCLRFDDLEYHLQYNSDSESLVVFSRIGVLQEDNQAEGLALMMSANLFWSGTNGATLACQPGDNLVFLQNKTRVQGLDYQQFEQWLTEFVGTAEGWVKRIDQVNEGTTPQTVSPEPRPVSGSATPVFV